MLTNELTQPQFRFDPGRGAIVFRVPSGGASAPGRSPHSELREMIGGAPAALSATSGVHTFTVCQAVTRLPVGQPQVVTTQIHDAYHAVLQIPPGGHPSGARRRREREAVDA